MKKFTFILASLFLSQIVSAQDSLKHYEFGATIATVNSFNKGTDYYGTNKPNYELMNGLFFRYTYKRFGFRSEISFSENSKFYNFPIYQSNRVGSYANNKDFRIGIGGQYTLLKKKDWLYTYGDIFYRDVRTKGNIFYNSLGSDDIKYSGSTKGIEGCMGLGLKLKISKNFYLSPEAGYISGYNFAKSSYTPISTGETTNSKANFFNVNPVLKLRLTVKFK